MRALCICEKPSLMREIKSVYDKINFKDRIDFLALHGHCLTLYSPDDYDAKYKSWNAALLPIFPDKWKYKPTDKELVKKIKGTLKTTKYDYLINATDAEREGQNIFYSVYDHLKLKLPVKRIWLNDLNYEPIKYAIENMRDDQREPFLVNLTKAAKLRAYSDWLVGMNFTRATHLRVGRVKTPTLEILYKRELEIQNFVPTSRYYAQADVGFLVNNDKEFATEKECKQFIADELYKDIGYGQELKGRVLNYESKDNREYAPKLFSLGDLQATASAEFGYTLEDTLKIAQSLYEAKVTTYPRTDCSYLTSGDAARIPSMIDLINKTIGISPSLTTNVVPSRYVDETKVKAHGAIMLTGKDFELTSLSLEEQNVVKLIAKRMIATMMEPKITNNIKVTLDINGYKFKGAASNIVKEGYSILYKKKSFGSKSTDKAIPELKVDDELIVADIYSKKKTPTAPSRYTDGTLIKAMINIGNTLSEHDKKILKGEGDQGGIGTSATRANIVEDLIKTKWIKRNKKKQFEMTDEGMKVAQALQNYSFASASLTADWEDKLSKIVEGTYESEKYYEELKGYIKMQTDELVNNAFNNAFGTNGGNGYGNAQQGGFARKSQNNGRFGANNESDNGYETKFNNHTGCVCPICGKEMLEGKTNYYCQGHSDKSCSFVVWKTISSGIVTIRDLGLICEGKDTDPIKMVSKRTGKAFIARLRFDHEKADVVMVFEERKAPVPETTNIECGGCGGKVMKKHGKYGTFYQCQGCSTIVSEEFYSYSFTEDEVDALFNGKKVSGSFISRKNGKTFSANVFLNDAGKLTFDFGSAKK